jgi:pimeloyl-ACP methyl ester carboxylesterase
MSRRFGVACLALTLALTLSLALTACAPFSMYRTDINTVCVDSDSAALAEKCQRNTLQVLQPDAADQPGYTLGFIELDDQGQLWERGQMKAVLGSVDAQTSHGTNDYLMVVFVHGWKHNAGFDGNGVEDDNVAHFRDALIQLSAVEIALSRKIGKPARTVIGVYIGWRGASITTAGIDNLTFWDRKNTAHMVGHGQVTEVLQRLEMLRQQRIARDPDTRSRLIVVGHSFGGAVVFSALEQILESRFALSAGTPQQPAGPVQGFGNLVVLINPAFEAQLYAPLGDMAAEMQAYPPSQLPVLAILTSEADWATGVAFPLGRWFSTWFEKQRMMQRDNPVTGSQEYIDEHRADVDAVGHFEPYRTHTLSAVPRTSTVARAADTSAANTSQSASQKVRTVAAAAGSWEDDRSGGTIDFPGSRLQRTTNSAPRNPYLVVKVDKRLIADHNDIWGSDIREFITHLILISSQSANLQQRAQERHAAQQ